MAVAVSLAPHVVGGTLECEPVTVRLADALGPVSPELCLVDPELAERARFFLPEPVERTPLVVAVGVPVEPAPPEAELESRDTTRRSGRGVLALSGAGLALVVGVVAWMGPALSGDGEEGATAGVEGPVQFSAPPTDPDLAPDAVAALESQARAEPGSVVVREKLGAVYLRLRRWEDAEREFRALVVLAPNDRFAHFALGRALDEQGRRVEARKQFALARKMAASAA